MNNFSSNKYRFFIKKKKKCKGKSDIMTSHCSLKLISGISLILNDSLFTISFSENSLGIGERSLEFSVTITETTKNFSVFSLIISGFSLKNEYFYSSFVIYKDWFFLFKWRVLFRLEKALFIDIRSRSLTGRLNTNPRGVDYSTDRVYKDFWL